MISLNQPAPAFTLPDQNNTPVSLHDYKGKWVVVYFYPKDDTPGCTVEACSFRDNETLLTQAGVVVLGISKDTVASHKKFSEKFNLNFRILADPSTEVIQAYGAWQEKSMYGKKYMGIQRLTVVVDPEGNIYHISPKVTPKDHAKEILKLLQNNHK